MRALLPPPFKYDIIEYMSKKLTGRFWKWFHLVGILAMVALWAFATITKLVESVVFVSHVSMLALVLAEFSAWQASRTEQKEDENGNS